MFLMSKKTGTGSIHDNVKGLLVFSQESAVVRKPVTDEANFKVSFQKESKVLLHHLSASDDSKLE